MELSLRNPIIFFDLETTGTNILKDRIVEISYIKVMPSGAESERTLRVNPEMHIPEEATAVHHITDEDVKDKPGTAQEKLERLKAEAEEQMEETTPYLSDARTSEEMYKAMISKGRLDNRPEIKWNPIQDRL